MKGLKLSLAGSGDSSDGVCVCDLREVYAVFPRRRSGRRLAGLLVMVQGYRREDSADERGDSPKEK